MRAFAPRSAKPSPRARRNTAGPVFLSLVPDGRTKPIPANFTIVYGVMRHPNARTKTLGLPFFSKIALRAVAERLEMMGFNVELHIIRKD
jgi:uncharacterized protein (TIGR04141 family)